MALLQRLAQQIINNELGGTFEDKIEAYQFMNDNFFLDLLTEKQRSEFNMLVEGGQIETAPWRNFES
jgi:hypothetical protein